MAPLLDKLLSEKAISASQALAAENRCRRTGQSPEEAILSLELCPEETLYHALSDLSGIPMATAKELSEVSADALEKVPEQLSSRFQALPLSLRNGMLQMAFAHPPAPGQLEQLHLLLGIPCQPFLVTPTRLAQQRQRLYGLGAEKIRRIQSLRKEGPGGSHHEGKTSDAEEENRAALQNPPENDSVSGLVNDILYAALDARATDIHLEPFANGLRLRFRVDGLLQDVPTPKGMDSLSDAIISRIKVLAHLDLAEKRLPHDGRLRLARNGSLWDLRASLLPTRHGESLCLRILNGETLLKDLGSLGFSERHLSLLQEQLRRTSGLMLVTGPTGSGKTTTLYSILTHLMKQRPDLKIITVEDPVEYDIPGITQIQTHAEIGLTFGGALRSILRHDPDVILVGEIRDRETAEMAVQAAMTGHLVLATLHTNDAIGAANRLINMGVRPDLAGTCLRLVLAQRLVRRLCPQCAVLDDTVSPRDRQELEQAAKTLGIPFTTPRRATPGGCPHCRGTGYLGRVGVYEILLVGEPLRDLISAASTDSRLREEAMREGWAPFRQDALAKVLQGITGLAEVHRVC